MVLYCGITALLLLGSYFSTGIFRSYALRKGLMDVPNDRSSHTMPTPRGGGIVFVVMTFIIWVALMVWQNINSQPINSGNVYFLISSFFIAALGFLDDRFQLSAKIRLLFQILIFSLFLYGLVWIPFMHSINSSMHDNIWFLSFLGFSYLFLLWLTNLFNFMDGINGLATAESIFFLISITIFYHDLLFYPLTEIIWILVPLLIGFLLWNFPKAKLFMGDAGSSFLGAFIALSSIYLATTSLVRFMVCIILLAIFITDATVTLLQRLYNRENIFLAHRSHAYQQASRYFGSHVPVTLGVVAINVLWLMPWAYVVEIGMIKAGIAAFIAYIPVVILTCYFNAGRSEISEKEFGRISKTLT